jgi:hypothetical protein
MNKMIVANLVHRQVRSVISDIAIAVEVTLSSIMTRASGNSRTVDGWRKR